MSQRHGFRLLPAMAFAGGIAALPMTRSRPHGCHNNTGRNVVSQPPCSMAVQMVSAMSLSPSTMPDLERMLVAADMRVAAAEELVAAVETAPAPDRLALADARQLLSVVRHSRDRIAESIELLAIIKRGRRVGDPAGRQNG